MLYDDGVRLTCDQLAPPSVVLNSADTEVQEVFPDGHWEEEAMAQAVEPLIASIALTVG